MSFRFTDAVKAEVWKRQGNKCADCEDLLSPVGSHAHHVVPQQSGDTANPDHAWLREADNCVYLCGECHYAAHGYGNYRGFVANPRYFKNSHGGDKAAHRTWLNEVERFWDR